MRIAIVHDDDLTADDCQQLCAALAARGHDVTAYFRRQDRDGADVIAEDDFRHVAMCAGPAEALSAQEVLPFVGDCAAQLVRLWSADRPDIVHGYGWLGGLAAQLAARQQFLPTVQSFHGLASMLGTAGALPVNAERARLVPLLARNATWVTGGSNDDIDALARLRHSRARISVLSTGVDVHRYSPVGPALARTDLHRVLCLEPNPLSCNGFDKAMRILGKLAGTELVYAESAAADHRHDKERGRLKHLAAELGVGDRARFLGSVMADELPALLRSADVVVCTPEQAPRATTALQAMASGVAVVATAVGALADTVVHSVTGLLVSPNNPSQLHGALKTLQEQSFRREGMGATGRLRAESRFTWDRVALDTMLIYEQARSFHQTRRVASAG
ncbi:D-inositol 3-phosphate glycosyltransferase [Mycobacterium simulans]|uniref:D-inositol 3-phosphate glycosyltransferase n=1 Tax=Mycobacterium simulans TaxID=627089 RepID=A0A7Z7ISM5_9MYCO|nr:glycosyltransferase [Mycobacterium simulans]SOJ57801.1 D-inositol 3-phosphate glycosyltransferase [Mycobacterium simulans]